LAHLTALAIVLGVLLLRTMHTATVTAHDIPRQSYINGFVKVEPDQLELIVRVPLLLLGTMSFPSNAQRELDLSAAGEATERSLAAISSELLVSEDGAILKPTAAAGRISLPSDDSFADFETAIEHIAAPIAPDTTIYADQGFFDARFVYTIHSPDANFQIRSSFLPGLGESLRLIISYMPIDGAPRLYELTAQSGWVALDPRWHQAALTFVRIGFEHLLFGLDHLLFLFCLIIPFRDLRSLIPVVTAFTIGHSFTLIAAVYGVLPAGDWFIPLVEMFLAGSIVFMAIENIVSQNPRRRWLVAGAFGLVHGFGFASSMASEFQFAGNHLLLSLLSFNIGIELGQIVVLFAAVPVLSLVFKYVIPGRLGVVILSSLLAFVGWSWTVERFSALSSVDWPLPSLTAFGQLAFLTGLLLAIGAVAWLILKWTTVSTAVSEMSRSWRMKDTAAGD
jgi:hypothetical protein